MTTKQVVVGGLIVGGLALALSPSARKKTKKAVGLSDKILQSPESALKYIEKNINKGREKIINDSIHFGIGKEIYTYKGDANHYKIKGRTGRNSTFVYLTKAQTLKMLKGLMSDRGYLYAHN